MYTHMHTVYKHLYNSIHRYTQVMIQTHTLRDPVKRPHNNNNKRKENKKKRCGLFLDSACGCCKNDLFPTVYLSGRVYGTSHDITLLF